MRICFFSCVLVVTTVAVLLAKEPEGIRHVDPLGDPLPPGAVGRLGTVRFRHADTVYAFALSPDGKTLATAAGRLVVLWDAVSGKERCRFERHQPAVMWLRTPVIAFSPEGKTLASGASGWSSPHDKESLSDNGICLHDSVTGKELRRFLGHQVRTSRTGYKRSGVSWLAFTPDGKTLLSLGLDHTIRVWDIATGKEQRRIANVSGYRAALSRDGKIIAAVVGDIGNGKAEVVLWETNTAKEIRRLPYTGWIDCVVISPDGTMLAAGSGPEGDRKSPWKRPEDVVLRQLGTGRTIQTLRGHTGGIYTCAFSPDGKTLVSSSVDGTLRLWDVKRGKELGKIGEGRIELVRMLFSPDGKTLLTQMLGNDEVHTIRFWDIASRKEVRRFGGHQSRVGVLVFSSDSRLLASGSYDSTVAVWDVPQRRERHYLSAPYNRVTGVAFSADGAEVCSGSFGGSVYSREAKTGKQLRSFDIVGGGDWVAVAPGGKVLATWRSRDKMVRLWDRRSGKELRSLNPLGYNVNAVEFSADGRLVAVGGCPPGDDESRNAAAVTIWDVATGRRLHQFSQGHDARVLAFSADGRTLAVGYEETKVRIWEVATGGERLSFNHGGLSTALAISPDGMLLATAKDAPERGRGYTPSSSKDEQKVWLWDALTGTRLHHLTGHTGPVTSLAFSPNGRLLASGSSDTTVLLWDAAKLPRASRPKSVKLTAMELKACWMNLINPDAGSAFGSMKKLMAAPREAVELIEKRLPPVAVVEAKRMAKLLGELDGDDFSTREKASNELTKLGGSAEPALRKALAGGLPLEVRRRIERLLKDIEGQHLRIMRAIEVLERLGTHEARRLLERLAGGAAEARLTREARAALGRLGRLAAVR